MSSPLIRSPLIQGGTFYSFSSAALDKTKADNNDQLKFQYSKYALLNLPNVQVPLNRDNFIQFRTIDGAIFNGLNADDNINIAESFQNYALNLESLLLADDDFDLKGKQSVAERVFFKWLKELGAIRFQEASETEKSAALVDTRYTEEATALSGQQRYQRVVEFVGEIDAINNVAKGGQAYTEIYLNVPTRVGNTPTVLFKTLSDVNYSEDRIISPGNSEFILGRNSSTIHPDGLGVNAFYDYDAAVVYSDSDANWHNSLKADSYFTEPVTFEDPSNLEITKVQSDYGGTVDPFTDISFLRSKLDGIGLDFSAGSYADIATNPEVSTIQEYNSTLKAKNFEFNVILVYYDLYDVSTPDDRATNLAGIILIDNITPSTQGGSIQRLGKFKPNEITGLNGNSYGLKLNTKYDNSADNAAVETIINDFSQFSMDLFLDASAQLQDSVKILLDTQGKFVDVTNQVAELEQLVFSNDSAAEITARLDGLESSFNNAGIALEDSNALLDLIASNADRINAIVNGVTPLELQYNTDVLSDGPGIVLDKSTPNKIKVVNVNQNYVINDIFNDDQFQSIISSTSLLDLNQSNIKAYIHIERFTNMIRVNTENNALSNLTIHLDDSEVRFKEGQSVRLAFDTVLNLNNKNIIFKTDKINRFGFGKLNMSIGSIPAADLSSSKPIIEVTCLDELNYSFAIDILR